MEDDRAPRVHARARAPDREIFGLTSAISSKRDRYARVLKSWLQISIICNLDRDLPSSSLSLSPVFCSRIKNLFKSKRDISLSLDNANSLWREILIVARSIRVFQKRKREYRARTDARKLREESLSLFLLRANGDVRVMQGQ